MNQGRIWCVVHPTVGLPLLLGSVALTSLAVHTAVLTHTTWYGNSYQGSAKHTNVSLNGSSSLASADVSAQPGFTISVSPVTAAPGKAQTAFLVTVAPTTGAPAASKSVSLAQK